MPPLPKVGTSHGELGNFCLKGCVCVVGGNLELFKDFKYELT